MVWVARSIRVAFRGALFGTAAADAAFLAVASAADATFLAFTAAAVFAVSSSCSARMTFLRSCLTTIF